MKVKQFYNKNQFLIFDKEDYEKVTFQSYNSTIAIWDRNKNKLTLGCDWDYSTTTSRYLYLFIESYVNVPEIEEVNNQSNKRAYVRKLIDNGIIIYDDKIQ